MNKFWEYKEGKQFLAILLFWFCKPCKILGSFIPSLTPDACALVGDVVLQFGPEPRLSSSASLTSVVHQQESLVVVVQAAGVPRRVLDVVLSRKAALKEEEPRDMIYQDFLNQCNALCPAFDGSQYAPGLFQQAMILEQEHGILIRKPDCKVE